MPLYEYRCEACRQRFEVIRKFSDPELTTCALCGGGPVERLLSSPAIQFKGTGWYITDYSKKGKSGGDAAATPPSGDAKPAAGETAASATKTETSTPPAKPAATD